MQRSDGGGSSAHLIMFFLSLFLAQICFTMSHLHRVNGLLRKDKILGKMLTTCYLRYLLDHIYRQRGQG